MLGVQIQGVEFSGRQILEHNSISRGMIELSGAMLSPSRYYEKDGAKHRPSRESLQGPGLHGHPAVAQKKKRDGPDAQLQPEV